MRRVLFAAGVCVAPFIASQVGAQDSALVARDSSMLNTSSVSDAPWASRDMVRPVRPNPRERAVPSLLLSAAQESSGPSAVSRGAQIGGAIGVTAGVIAALWSVNRSDSCDSDCNSTRVYGNVAAVLIGGGVVGSVGALVGAGIGKVVQMAVSHSSGEP